MGKEIYFSFVAPALILGMGLIGTLIFWIHHRRVQLEIDRDSAAEK